MAQKVLIAGGSGLLGSHITEKLLAQGYAVNYLSRNPEKIERVKAYYWDPESGQFDEQALHEVEAVINLAGADIGSKGWSKKRKRLILESRTKSAAFLRDQLKKGNNNVKVVISPSATGYYGIDNGDQWLKESADAGNDFLATVVKAWEDEALLFNDLDLRVVIFRFGVVLSAKGGALKKLVQPIKLWAGAPLGSGKQWMSWIHIDDVAGLVGYALKKENIRGIYNGVAPEPVTNEEFTHSAAKALHKPLIMPNIPKFALQLAVGERSTILLGSNRVSADKITETGYNFKYSKADKALRDLLS